MMTTVNATSSSINQEHFIDNWQWVRLGDVCSVKGGKRLPAGEDFAKSITPFPYIRVVDFSNGTVKTGGLKYLKPETQRQIERYIIRKDDVYISIAGSIGIVGTIPDDLDGANLTENAARLVIQDKTTLHRDFLALFLQSPTGQEAIRLKTNKVGQPKLALERIAAIEIPLAPLQEQERIATILKKHLEAVERARYSAEEQLNTINNLPAALLREAFNGKL